MIIKIQVDDTLSPEKAIVEINGNAYKNIDGLKLILAKNGNGNLTIQHQSGFLEAYQGNDKQLER